MPVLTSCEARSPPAVESPPRKKFKLSLKLKTKKKNKTTNLMSSDSEHDSGEENCDSVVNCGRKEVLNGSLTKSTNSMTDANTTFGLQCDDVSPPLPYTGLANLGNTCYLNAVVQVLRYCPGFLKSLVNLDEISAKNCLASNDLVSVVFYTQIVVYYGMNYIQ
jgi:ubiquitin C-terminal hydrolase